MPGAGEEELEDGDERVIAVDAWRVPRGRCTACSSCALWKKASGPFSHLNCGSCKCKTTDHEDLSPWMRAVLEHSTPSVESRLVGKGIPLKAYTHWSPLETLFHLETDGAFNPARDRRGNEEAAGSLSSDPCKPLCSVICPTTSERHAFHPLLYHCFCQQTYEPRELVVVDTGPRPSSFLAERAKRDPAVVYRWFKDGRWTIGTKRNLACFLSKGEIIAHFDDDDLYAPDYLSHMNRVILDASSTARSPPEAGLGELKAAATLTSWHVFDTAERTFRFLHAVSDKWVYGWGFSFVFTKEAWSRNFFPYRDVGEDFDFMMALRKLPGSQVLVVEDTGAICSHTYHPKLSISGGEKRRDGTQNPIGQDVPPPDSLVPLLPMLFEAERQSLRSLGKRLPPSEEDYSYSVLGSWDGWSRFNELRRSGTGRYFTATIHIPNVPSCAEFQVFANNDWTLSFYPNATGMILGPWRCPGANWKIQVTKGCSAISVSWDPSGERKLTVQPVSRNSSEVQPTASLSSMRPSKPPPQSPKSPQSGPTPKPASTKPKKTPTLNIVEAIEMQEALMAAYRTEEFQQQLREIWGKSAHDPVLRMRLRQDICLPIQGPIISRYGFESTRLGVAQTVAIFKTADWATDPTVTVNNHVLAVLCDLDAQLPAM